MVRESQRSDTHITNNENISELNKEDRYRLFYALHTIAGIVQGKTYLKRI